MAADSLHALGLELRAEAVAWLADLAPAALPDGTLAARELFQALGELEAEVAEAAANEVELTRLQAWLTAGFFPEPEPYAPADAVVAEVMDEARRRDAADAARVMDAADAARVMDAADAAPASGDGWAGAAPASGGGWAGAASAAIAGAGAGAADVPGVIRGAPAGANEFAAGNSQSPPARTASAGFLSPEPGLPEAPAPGEDKQPPAIPATPLRGRLFGTDSEAQAENERIASGSSPAPGDGTRREPPARGIQGLAALAALAGRGGVEIPPPREDADRAAESIARRDAPDRAATEPGGGERTRDAARVDVDRADAVHPSPRHSMEEREPSSAERLVVAGTGREVERRVEDVVHPPPRVARLPFTPPATEDADGVERRVDDAAGAPPRIIRIPFTPAVREEEDGGWETDTPPSIPFLSAPGEVEEDAGRGGPAEGAVWEALRTGAPVSGARQPIAMPSMRVFDGAASEPVRGTPPSTEWEWAGVEAPRESAGAFLARAARLAAPRLRPAAEIAGAAAPATVPSASAARPIAPAATPEVQPAIPPVAGPEQTVVERTVVRREAAGPEPLVWAAPDVTELLDALASEIAHEYRRYYGE